MTYRELHKKHEAKYLVFVIQNSTVRLYGETSERIFSKILSEIKAAEKSRSNIFTKMPELPYEAPFIQGDGVLPGLPDIIYEGDDFVLGIEDFEFDSSGKEKYGSKMHMAETCAEKELDDIRKSSSSTNSPLCIETKVHVTFSYEGYIKSFLNGFGSHSKKIENYKEAMRKQYPGKKNLFAFFAEDTTALGSYVRNKNGNQPIYPLFVKEILDEVETTRGIDLILFRTQNFYTYTLYVQQISSETISALRMNTYNMNENKYFSYQYKMQEHIYRVDKKDDTP